MAIRVPRPLAREGRSPAELDVGERAVISDVLNRLRVRFARLSLSITKQLEWDDAGAHSR